MASAAYLFRACLDFKTCGEGMPFLFLIIFSKKLFFLKKGLTNGVGMFIIKPIKQVGLVGYINYPEPDENITNTRKGILL